jgi:hypothetical protein
MVPVGNRQTPLVLECEWKTQDYATLLNPVRIHMDLDPTISNDKNAQAPSKKVKQLPKGKLAEFIAEALQIERERMAADARKFTIPLHLGPGWPFWDVGPVSSAVSKEMGQPEKSIREIKWRLKQFLYRPALRSRSPDPQMGGC